MSFVCAALDQWRTMVIQNDAARKGEIEVKLYSGYKKKVGDIRQNTSEGIPLNTMLQIGQLAEKYSN